MISRSSKESKIFGGIKHGFPRFHQSFPAHSGDISARNYITWQILALNTAEIILPSNVLVITKHIPTVYS